MKPTIIALIRFAVVACIVCGSIAWHKSSAIVCKGKAPSGALYTLTVTK
jgi:hypothetical protein